MAHIDVPRGAEHAHGRPGHQCADIPAVLVASSARTRRRPALLVGLSSAALVLTLAAAPTAAADTTSDLRAAVLGVRAGCPSMQADSTLDKVAERANYETQAYYTHTAQSIPFEDPMPELRDLGYHANKAKLIPSYGDSVEKAIGGITMAGFQAIPDCSYTRYGVNVLDNSSSAGYVLAALMLVGD